MKSKRLAWAEENKNWTLVVRKKVVFSEETYFFVGGKHSCFVRSVGERVKPCHLNQQAKHTPKNVLGMLQLQKRWIA